MKQEHNSSLTDLQINMLFVIALKIFCVILLVWEDKLPQSSLPSYFFSLFYFFHLWLQSSIDVKYVTLKVAGD